MALGCPGAKPDATESSAAPPAAETPVAETPAATAAEEKEDRWKPYRLFSDAIGVREGVEAGLLRDGETMEFKVTDPESGKPLSDATMTIGEGPDAIVIRSDAEGRLAFPLRVDLAEKNPKVRLVSPSTDHPEIESNMQKSVRFHCDAKAGFVSDAHESISPDQLAALRHGDFGPDRVSAVASGVTEAHMQAMGKHLVKLRAAYVAATGWDPPPAHVLLAPDPKGVAVESGPGQPAVWVLSPDQIADHDRATAHLAHEWTHVTLAARKSAAFDPTQRWIEDGLCELVAFRVETRMFPRAKSTRVAMRVKELSLPDAPASYELLDLQAAKDAKSLFGALASMCDGVRVYGYGYAFAFWLAAVPDAASLPKALKELDAEPLLGLARKRATKAFAELVVDRDCAKKVLAGKPACAKG